MGCRRYLVRLLNGGAVSLWASQEDRRRSLGSLGGTTAFGLRTAEGASSDVFDWRLNGETISLGQPQASTKDRRWSLGSVNGGTTAFGLRTVEGASSGVFKEELSLWASQRPPERRGDGLSGVLMEVLQHLH